MKSVLPLARLNLRTSRGFIFAWLIPLWTLVAIFPFAYEDYYPTLESRQEMLQAMAANAGTTALYGIIAPPGTVGQVLTWEIGAWVGVLGSVMSILLAVRWHRGAESTGLGELQRSTGIRPRVPLLAMLFSTTFVAALLGTGTTAVLLGVSTAIEDVSTEGSWALGLSISLMSIGSVLLSQLVLLFFSEAPALTRVALFTVAASFMLRAYADVEKLEWLNWFSPLGWRELIGAYDDNDWANAGWLALITIGAAILLMALNSRRAFARGLIVAKLRRSTRPRRIPGMVGLVSILNQGSIIAWAMITAILSAFLMSMSGSIQELVAGEGQTGEVFRDLLGGTAAYEAFISFICQVVAILITVAAVSIIHSEIAAERSRVIDIVRSTGVRRWLPLASVVAVAILASLLWIAVMHGASALGLAFQDSTLDEDYTTLAWSAWSQAGAVMFFIGLATFVAGFVSRGTTLTWMLLALAAVSALMGEMLGFPQWSIDASPFTHGMINGESEAGAPVFLLLTGVVLTLAGLLGASRREVR